MHLAARVQRGHGPLVARRVAGGRSAVKVRAAPAGTAKTGLRQPVSGDREALTADVPLNLYGGKKGPFIGKVVEIRDMGGRNKERHVSHIIIETGGVPFVEGQSFGVIPPGTKLNSKGKEVPHGVRLYSIASGRYGDARDGKTCTLCIVRVVYRDESGQEVRGLCSNYLCDRAVGDDLAMTGPSGTVMLLPEDHMARDVVCVSTGTGIAPFRSFWRRLFYDAVPGRPYGGVFTLYAGFANRDSILYGDELEAMEAAYPGSFKAHMALSLERRNRAGGMEYVQDKIAEDADAFLRRMQDGSTVFYLCGLKRMYASVLEVLEQLGKERGVDAAALIAQLKKEHRWHVETA